MSWLFSQALVEEYLVDISSDGEQSVQSNGNNTQQAYCAPDKMTDFYRVSQFGMMFKPLTESLGKELLMSYLEDFHAKTFQQQAKGGGITGSRSSMWKHMARIIGEVRPKFVFVENSPALTTRGLGTVLSDLAQMGFDAEWGVLSAANVGANHKRERIWIVAKQTMGNSRCQHGEKGLSKSRELAQNNSSNISKRFSNVSLWDEKVESDIVRMDYGMASRVDRLKAIGNGQVPLCAATAWRLLKERLDGQKQRGMA